jgi:hypothetical protein
MDGHRISSHFIFSFNILIEKMKSTRFSGRPPALRSLLSYFFATFLA